MCRIGMYLKDTKRASLNRHNSPLYDIFRVTDMFGMLNMAIGMANNTHFFYGKMKRGPEPGN